MWRGRIFVAVMLRRCNCLVTFAQFDVMKVSNIDVHAFTFQTTRFLCQARPGTKNVQRLR